MIVSLIISTYNWPRALYLCLDSVMQQSVLPDEILVADDGSGMDTRDVVRHFEQISPVPVRHIWHEDRGFRVAAIRNKAIAASRSDYLIQIDGDLILQRNFIQDHLAFARRGCYVAGSRGMLTQRLTQQVLNGEITSLSPLTRGVYCSNNVMRIPIMSAFYRMLSPEYNPRSCNMALWREDALRVNGYDEAFEGWGFEDTEFGLRLKNSGVRQLRIKFRAVAFHLFHEKVSRERCLTNEHYYLESIREHRTRCKRGIDQYVRQLSPDNPLFLYPPLAGEALPRYL